MSSHYQLSNNIDPIRTSSCVAIALVVIVGLSFLYNAIISMIPIIYLAVIAPIGYAIVLGLLTRAILHFGKFRSRTKGIALALTLGLVANYTQWMAYLDFTYIQDFQVNFNSYIDTLFGGLGPGEAARIIADINEYGTWTIGASSATPVNGLFLAGIWLVEFLILLLYPAWTIRNNRSKPFSENQDRFYDQFELENLFQAIYTPNKAEPALADDPLAYLKLKEMHARFPGSRVEVYYLADESDAYISILRARMDEKKNEIRVPVVKEFRISNREAKRILDEFSHQKDRLNIFTD